jgi:hypothetical protein
VRTPTSLRERIAIAALAFGVATPVTYVLERMLEWASGENGDPRLVLRTLHTAYYWRAIVAFWWGGVVAILVYVWLSTDRAPARTLRVLGILASVLLPLAILATLRFP